MTKKSMLGRNKANMETSECIYPPKPDDLEKEESGRVGDLKVSLPPNVIGTQLTGKVKRFGVKLRYNGCPLRIGSAYCTPEDANKVASAFRDCIQIDSKGNLFFAQDVLNKYTDLYVNRYLPFTRTKNRIQVVTFLSRWLKDWKKKSSRKKKKRRKSKNKDARVPTDKTETTNLSIQDKTTSESERKSFASAVWNTGGYDEQQDRREVNGLMEINPVINNMLSIIKTVLSVNGMNHMGEKHCDGYTVHSWQNGTLQVSVSVRPLLHLNNKVPSNMSVSSQSNSTEEEEEEENDSNSPYFTSDADSFEHLNDFEYLDCSNFNSYFGEVADLHIESLVPNSVVKYEMQEDHPGCCVLIAVKGSWDNNCIMQGSLVKVDGETESVSEEKTFDILCAVGTDHRSAYFSIDLKEYEISKYKFKLIATDLVNAKTATSNRVDFEIKRPAYASNKALKIAKNQNGGDSSDNGSNNDYHHDNNTYYGSNINDHDDNGYYHNNSNNDFHNAYTHHESNQPEISGSDCNKCQKLQHALNNDIELGTSKSQLTNMLPKGVLPHFKFGSPFNKSLVMPISILLVSLVFPNSTRGSTFKTDSHLQSCYSFVDKIGITDLSIRACSIFTNEATCSAKISYLSIDSFGSPLEYGPDDYFTKVREPMPFASNFGYLVSLLLPLSSYFLLLNYFNRPYERDRLSSQYAIFLTVAEILYYFYEGYSMIFSLSHLASIVLIIVMEGYINRSWSVETYAKYRLEYRTIFTFVLYLCHLTIRPWVVKHYGKYAVGDLPIVSMTFAPVCQRMFAQNLPVLIGVKKGPASFTWLPYLAAFALILSIATATSIDSLNAQTIFQLWPYYIAPYFVAFSVATLIKWIRLPALLQYVVEENPQFSDWYV